jgi:hypothetical protein
MVIVTCNPDVAAHHCRTIHQAGRSRQPAVRPRGSPCAPVRSDSLPGFRMPCREDAVELAGGGDAQGTGSGGLRAPGAHGPARPPAVPRVRPPQDCILPAATSTRGGSTRPGTSPSEGRNPGGPRAEISARR